MAPFRLPSKVRHVPSGRQKAIKQRKEADLEMGGTSLRSSRSFALFSASLAPSTANRAENTPGAPWRKSTTRPESSDIDGIPVPTAAAEAFLMAFSSNV